MLLSYHWLPAERRWLRRASKASGRRSPSPVAPGATVTLDGAGARARAAGPVPPRVGPRAGRAACGSAPSRARCASCRARSVDRRCRRATAARRADAAAASDRAARTRRAVARRGADVRRPSARSASAPTTSAWPTARTPGLPTARSRARTATTCISRCSPAAACSSACAFLLAVLARAPAASRGSRAARRRSDVAPALGVAAAGARDRLHAAVDSFLSFAPTYVLFSLTLGCAVACARGAGGPGRCASRLTAPRCGRAAPASATTPSTCCTTSRAAAANDELIVVSNRPIDTTSPLPPRVRVATPSRRVPRMVWMQTLARDRAARSRGRRRPLHQRHGAADVAGADRRDDSRHEPAALSALPPAAARAAEPAARRSRRAPRRRDHHGRRKAPSATSSASTASTRAACTSCTKRRRRRSGACTIRPSSSASGAATAWPIASSSTSARSSRERTCRR